MMKFFVSAFQMKVRHGLSFAVLASFSALAAVAQGPQARIQGSVENGTRTTIAGSKPPRARAANDAGRMPSDTKIEGVSLVFNRSDAQQAALGTLLAAQQDPSSAMYHQWLTPDQFAAQFGMADADLAKVRTWLEGQGFSVDAVSRGRDRLTFSGTAAQIGAAFETELHYFKSGTETHFAPANDLTVPSAFAGSVGAIGNLSDFRPKPHVRMSAAPLFNSGQTSSHFLTPGDVATIYDVKAAYNAGYTGTGQSIAVVGQSAIIPSDITNFQNASGLALQAPTMVLMPGTGASALNPYGSGDESESDLDLEYSGGIAKGASIYFVYTGNSKNYDVFDALTYAVTNRIAPIVTASYGDCETDLGSTTYTQFAATFQQAAAQGQTIVASSGDDGSTDCYEFTDLTSTQRTALAVDFPASSPYVTGLGGTEFLAADVTTTNTTYWAANTGSDIISSALQYIPEMVWNDDSASGGLSSGGGGASIYSARPTWQLSGVPGLSSIVGTNRLVPDLALSSSPNNAGYLYCSSDTGSTGVEGSCTHGFRDANSTYLTVAGGTSFAAPVFAGMLAIINQATKSSGQGLINPTLYSLASSATTYATAFHDITSGNNECTAGANYCTTIGLSGFAAGTGYDEASGLGSVDLYQLLSAWPGTTVTTVTASTLTLTPATTVPKIATTDVITISVGPGAIANGTVSITVNGGTAVIVPITNGVGTYSFTAATAGQDVLIATYSGSATYSSSTATLVLQVGGTGTFSISATSPTITDGSTGTATVTVTPSNGYTGTVGFAVTSSPTIADACYTVTNASVTGTAAATATISIITNEALCTTGTTTLVKHSLGSGIAANRMPARVPERSRTPLGLAFAGLLTLGWLGRRSRGLKSLVAVALLAVAGFGISGCGSGTVAASPISSVPVTNYATKGAYTIVVQGTDTTNTAATAYATFTLTVD